MIGFSEENVSPKEIQERQERCPAWWLTPVIQHLRDRDRRIKGSRSFWVKDKLEASLRHRRPRLKRERWEEGGREKGKHGWWKDAGRQTSGKSEGEREGGCISWVGYLCLVDAELLFSLCFHLMCYHLPL